MKLHTLGTGGPRLDSERGSACHVLEVDGRYLMFDVGRGAIRGVAAMGFPIAEIGPLFVSHLHVDHIGELANYLITSHIEGRHKPLKIYGPPGTAGIVEALLGLVYERDIAFRDSEAGYGTFVGAEVNELQSGQIVEGEGWRARCEEVEHGHGLGFGPKLTGRWICFAWRVEAEGKSFCFSGDAVMCDGPLRAAERADLHLQCCYLPASALSSPHMRRLGDYTLACSDTAGKIADRARVDRLVLTHFRQTTQAVLAEIESDVRCDYAGPVELSNDLDTFEF
ncbi:MAG TPA: MBL fold metallo-hydrolase [Stellaceae bacterium]|nr:MBL fold metallo-hydrolase [Stellaceae bacterium]